MGNNTKSCLAALAVIAIACLFAWLGGYNFDSRGGDEAAAAMYALLFAVMAATLVRDDW